MIEILMYLFEKYMEKDTHLKMSPDQLTTELQQVGYMAPDIESALAWLDGLNAAKFNEDGQLSSDVNIIRSYHPSEAQQIDAACQGFLIYLQQAGIITPLIREIIIDRVLALGHHNVSLNQLKWVSLMVLFSRPCEQHALVWMQDFILNTEPTKVH